MLLTFLRHAEAESHAKSDFDRELTAKGREQAGRVAGFLHATHLVPSLILASPLARARQTGQILAHRLKTPLQEAPWLAAGMQPETCLQEVQQQAGNDHVLLVAHEPDLSEVIGHILGVADPSVLKIRKASLTGVELADFHAGCGLLHFFVPVRLMLG